MSVSGEQFKQLELPFPKGDWDKGRHFEMPNEGYSGYTKGHHQARLYRVVDLGTGEKHSAESGGIGLHWTHDLGSAKWLGENMDNPRIYEAAHPGYEHVMDYDNPSDARTLKETTGFAKEHAHEMTPAEVPIRPGAPMRIMAVHNLNQLGDSYRRVRHEQEGRA